MTPEREARMREAFEKWKRTYAVHTAFALGESPSKDEIARAAWDACARALEPMVRDGERYRFLRDEMDLSVRDVFSSWCPQLNDGLDAAIDAAMSAALEDGNAKD